jgi:hypothetical protein
MKRVMMGLLLTGAVAVGGCTTNDRTLRSAGTGAAIGAGVGAAGTAVAGGDVLTGAAVGAGVGAAAGAVAANVGNQQQGTVQEQQTWQQQQQPTYQQPAYQQPAVGGPRTPVRRAGERG